MKALNLVSFASCFLAAASFAAAKEAGQPAAKNECKPMTFHHGDALKRMKRVDELLAKLGDSKNPTKDVNAFIAKHGLPIRAGQTKAKPPKGHIEDAMSAEVVVFLKALKDDPKKGYALDAVYEVASSESTKALREWRIPGNAARPLGFLGKDIVIEVGISNPCGDGACAARTDDKGKKRILVYQEPMT